MAAQPRRITRWEATKDVAVRATNTDWAGKREGSSQRSALYAGRLGDKLHRSFIDFGVDFADMSVVVKAELVIFTAAADGFNPGSEAKVCVYRLLENFNEQHATATGWHDDQDVNPSAATGGGYRATLNRTIDGETRINVTYAVNYWKKYSGKRHGFRIDANDPRHRAGAFTFHSSEAANAALRPYIEVTYEPPNYAPDLMNTVSPNGTVLPGTPFEGQFGDPNGDRPESIEIDVHQVNTGDHVKTIKAPFDTSWLNVGGIWEWQVPNPGPPDIPSARDLRWRAQGTDPGGKSSGWTPWREFRQSGTAPTITLRAVGSQETLVGYEFQGTWHLGSSRSPSAYRIQLRRTSDPWTLPLWDETIRPLTASERTAGHTLKEYTGPNLGPGDYVWRMNVTDDASVTSVWSAEDTFDLSVGSEPATDDGTGYPPNSTGYARERSRVRIVLYANDNKSGDPPVLDRGPGTIKAIIEDPTNVGMSTVVNEGGEFYFTLPATHPQASECEPWQRHYALQQYRNGNWFDIHNGMIVDFDAGDNDIVVYGYDYMGVLSRSIDTRFPAFGTNEEADHAHGGAKYKNELISEIIKDQLTQARTQKDSPLAFIRLGVIEGLDPRIHILSAFKQRLYFIRGLIDSAREGAGNRTRLKPRQDPSQWGRWEWDLRKTPGHERNNLKLSYGGLLQNFRVIAMGTDYATRAHGMGTSPSNTKPRYFVHPSAGSSDFLTSTFGNLQRVEIFQDLDDENDLKRRVKQMLKESSKVGQRINMAIRVHGINPWDGYDLTDQIPIDIDYGVVNTEAYGSGYWTIWGLEWRLFPDGHDELTWAVRPREDLEDPDPSLVPSRPIHDEPEWALGNGPPDEADGGSSRYYLDMDTGTVYERPPADDATDMVVWEEVGTIPGDGSGSAPPGYPGDNTDPAGVWGFDAVGDYRQQDDGSSIPIVRASWVLDDPLHLPEDDILGYELQWQAGFFGDPDPENPSGGPVYVPPDWSNPQSSRVGAGMDSAVLEPVIGGDVYSVRIRAYDMETRVGPWVTDQPVTMKADPFPPEIPEASANDGYRTIGLSWDESQAADLDRYEVRYRKVGDTDYAYLSTRSTHIVIGNLEIGPAPDYADVEYEANVRAIDSSDNVREAGDPEAIPPVPDVTRRPASDWLGVGWSNRVTAKSTTVPQTEVAFEGVIADVIEAGFIDADSIKAGDLRVGGTGKAGTIRVYNTAGQPIGAWGPFGWLIADPNRPTRALWANPQGELRFTNQYGKTVGTVFTPWDGTETLWAEGDAGLPDEDAVGTVRLGIEQHVATTVWQTAITPDGIRADAILLGAIGGGNNRALNAGFELLPPETNPLLSIQWDQATEWDDAVGGINLKVTGAALQMTAI